MFENNTMKTVRRVAYVLMVFFVAVVVFGFIDYRLGILPSLDSAETQQRAAEVADEAQELLRDQGIPPLGQWDLYSMSQSWSRLGGARDGGAFEYRIDGDDSYLITVEWSLQGEQLVVTSVDSTKAEMPLYGIR